MGRAAAGTACSRSRCPIPEARPTCRAAARRARRQGIADRSHHQHRRLAARREADAVLVTGAGAERAIPSTKGFTVRHRGVASPRFARGSGGEAASLVDQSSASGRVCRGAMARAEESSVAVEESAAVLARARFAAFIGGGLLYPVACDAALKFLEVTYSPALAFPPDEFRHGPMAIVQDGFAFVALAPPWNDRLISETRSRGGEVVVVGGPYRFHCRESMRSWPLWFTRRRSSSSPTRSERGSNGPSIVRATCRKS